MGLEGEENANAPSELGQSRVIGKKQTIAEALAEVRGEKLSKEQKASKEQKNSKEQKASKEQKNSREQAVLPEQPFSVDQELTKEQDAAIDAEMEAILKESLDSEYFQWVGKEKPEDKQEKKGLARFLKNT